MLYFIYVYIALYVGVLLPFSVGSQRSCHPTQFQCRLSKTCIDRDLVVNGRKNCGEGDESDEEEPLKRCHPQTEFRCRGNGQCIPRERINRPVSLCSDSSDEGGITGYNCIRKEEIRCDTGWCKPRRKVRHPLDQCFSKNGDGRTRATFSQCDLEIYYNCSDGRCIGRDEVSDGKKDCRGGEDEENSLRCTEDEYRCENGRCVPRHQVERGFKNCDADQTNRTFISCFDDKEFACGQDDVNNDIITRCIPRDWVNDGIHQCEDGTDEKVTSFQCNTDELSCDNGTKCLSKKRLCDGVPDCMDCSDETDLDICSKKEALRFFLCKNPIGLGDGLTVGNIVNSHCVLRSYFCDGIRDCRDGSDETESGSGFKCRITKKKKGNTNRLSRTCIVPERFLNDGVADCDDATDESNANDDYIPCSLHPDPDGKENKIKTSQVCDGVFDCTNLSDECRCDVELYSEPDKTVALCDNICYEGLKIKTITNTTDHSIPCMQCGVGQLMCDVNNGINNVKCIQPLSVCDGVSDCIDKSDELICVFGKGSNSQRAERKNLNDTYPCRLDEYLSFLSQTYSEILHYGHRCDGVPECVGMADECDDVTDAERVGLCKSATSKPLYCEYFSGDKWKNFFSISNPLLPSAVCDGIVDLDNGEDELYCNDTRFYCHTIPSGIGKFSLSESDQGDLVSIERALVCDGHVDCVDQSDERNCSEHFYCLNSADPFFISREKVLDGKSDCIDGSDECPKEETLDNDPLSSRDELIKHLFFRVWIWVISILALCGNAIVLTTTMFKILRWQQVVGCPGLKQWMSSREENRKTHHVSPLSTCNDVLVLNLSIADFLTGLYLFIIAVKSITFSGSYCIHEAEWRSSSQCESLGIMVLTCIQVSVGVMVILTSYRLLAVVKPWKVQYLKTKHCVIFVSIVWIIAAVVGLIPTFPSLRDVFVTSAFITKDNGTKRSLYFSSKVVSKESMMSFARRSCVLIGNDVSQNCVDFHSNYITWEILMVALEDILKDVEVSGYFGYYSGHGVCLPGIYPVHEDRIATRNGTLYGNAAFTVFIMSVSFLSFLYIALAYSVICHKSTRSFRKMSSSNIVVSPSERRVSEVNKRIARLVLTNFVCWVPICLISFCVVSGLQVPHWLYSFTVVILLPINSAVNPFLYSDVINKFFQSCFKKLKRKVRKDQADITSHLPRSSTEMTNQYSTQQSRRISSKPDLIDNSRKLRVGLNQAEISGVSYSSRLNKISSKNKTQKQSSGSSQESLNAVVQVSVCSSNSKKGTTV